ncbi:FixH family protein [Pedomonas mirosovicensis]|uniref:FixH family protein n=1 Tax=Pedomonas mirosovicensis TaxID=2908641 RepID=UPI002169AD4C|nr:FixH family protein [Pedomonas mirosovicensis]MCH8686243.1 FixH family protein [Pedomonas mirosovicensis]
MTTSTHPRPFTGRRLALILCAMFAVVMAVNFTMATLASRTFSGAVVANGYVANQDFNTWIAQGKAQAALGWSATASVKGGRLVVAARNAAGEPLAGARVRVHLIHPFRASLTRWLDLREAAPGRYVAEDLIPRGQWDADIRLEAEGRIVLVSERLFVSGGNAS